MRVICGKCGGPVSKIERPLAPWFPDGPRPSPEGQALCAVCGWVSSWRSVSDGPRVTERVTDRDIETLEYALKHGTPVPWSWFTTPGDYVTYIEGSRARIFRTAERGNSFSDAHLLVSAVNALPRLIAEIKRLRLAERVAVADRDYSAAYDRDVSPHKGFV